MSNNARRPQARGLFQDGVWLCDCTPRLPASYFQTRKPGANQGRWFYTCQKQDGKGCKIFLWDDDAKLREEAAVLSNSRTEPVAGRQRSPPPPYAATTSTEIEGVAAARKRSFDEFGESDEELFSWPATGVAEAQTPRKAMKLDGATTPSRRRLPWLEEETKPDKQLLTPQSKRKSAVQTPRMSEARHALPTPSTSGHPSSRDNIGRPGSLRSPDATPTPSRFRDVNASGSGATGLLKDVMDVLSAHRVHLPAGAKEALSDVLTKHELRDQGIIKGRDISRLALKAKDAKILELQHRVGTVEAELETEKAIVQHLRWERATGLASDEERVAGEGKEPCL